MMYLQNVGGTCKFTKYRIMMKKESDSLNLIVTNTH